MRAMPARLMEIDGVPLLRATGPGPARAGLAFRAGRADETPATAGVTHLIEHLVLRRLRAAPGSCGGGAPVLTTFATQGTATEVSAFLTGVCAALADLPSTLDDARAELRAEAAARTPTVFDSLAVVRHGVHHHGLAGMPEWGLHTLTADDVRAWAAEYFTGQNAVLWVTGPELPSGLRLALPPGVRKPVPDATTETGPFGEFRPPAHDTIVRDEVQPAGIVTAVYAGVLERAVFHATGRVAGDGAHRVEARYRPRGDGLAAVTVLAEVFAGNPGPVAGEFLDALAELRAHPIREEHVAAVVAETDRTLLRSGARLPEQAFALLTGHPEPPLAELRARLRAVTADEVGTLAASSQAAELLLTSWNGLIGPSPAGAAPVAGRRFRSLENRRAALTMDKTAITRTWPRSRPVTVPFASAAVLLKWPDGGRRLIGPDARHVDVEPTLHETAPDVVPAIDAAVPADRHVPLPAREADAIPIPRPRGEQAVRYGGAGALLMGLIAWVLAWGSMTLAITPGATSWPVTLFGMSWLSGFWGAVRLRSVRNTVVAHRRMTRAHSASGRRSAPPGSPPLPAKAP